MASRLISILGVSIPLVIVFAYDEARQVPLNPGYEQDRYAEACPAYQDYVVIPHPPYSRGPLALPYQRPAVNCRTFTSPLVEKVIEDVTSRMIDADLARIFENAFPNTLDTTVSWHADGSKKHQNHGHNNWDESSWAGPQSFIVTGDITAEWLRDSTNQLQGYQALAAKDPKIASLIRGAINTQAEYVIKAPYCNAFQPPPPSNLPPTHTGQGDNVHPVYEPNFVFECKYELDSLAHFLRLGNEYYKHTGDADFLTERWSLAVGKILDVLFEQSRSTFNESTGEFEGNEYLFRRRTDSSTETLGLQGLGNPIRGSAGLVRSAFRPSDDATILPFFVPANAMMSVELRRSADILKQRGKRKLSEELTEWSESIHRGLQKYAIVSHRHYGEVYAFEVDGYGSQIIMDDANIPSLLSLPFLGYVTLDDKVYQNTRKMILEKKGNPYYLSGDDFSGIGGPHIGLEYAWPMSLLMQAMTSADDKEIIGSLNAVRNVSQLGLIHESINVNFGSYYTRSWFAWANSVFAQTILDLAERKPHIVFGEGSNPYIISEARL